MLVSDFLVKRADLRERPIAKSDVPEPAPGQALQSAYLDVLEGRVPPKSAHVLSPGQ
jgi:hypothetical protein